MQTQRPRRRPDGIEYQERTEPREFLSRELEGHGEYIHVYPDEENREIRIYRTVGERRDEFKIQTTIENVRFTLQTGEHQRLDHWYLTGGEALTLLTWLECLKWERTPASVRVSYYEDTQKGLTEGNTLTEESLRFEYQTESGRGREVQVANVWETPTHKLANE